MDQNHISKSGFSSAGIKIFIIYGPGNFIKEKIPDFKLSPYSKCCMLSSG
jgi:hypothetical protein